MKKHSALKAVFEEINDLIRSGQASEASAKFKAIKTKRLADADERVQYSSLSRRLSLPQYGLKLFHPRVRPAKSKNITVTDSEKVEYAALLVRIGAIDEGLEILKSTPPESNPHVFFVQAFAYITQWDYENANKLFYRYIQSKTPSHYGKMVATANLCEGLVYQMDPKANDVINRALIDAKKHNYTIVYGHIQMTRANHAIQRQAWKEAEEALDESSKCFTKSDTLEDLFIRKWKAILYFSKGKDRNTKELHKVREEAEQKWKHWETVRDCDYIEAITTKNKSLFQRLYFGTPYPSFRKKLTQKWSETEPLPEKYAWNIAEGGKSGQYLEFFSGNTIDRKNLLKARKQIGELLSILSLDFYRPMRLVTIHAKLFPTDYFNPLSSILRVRTVIHHTREWLKSEKYNLKITGEEGMYRLSAQKPTTLILPKTTVSSMKDDTFQKTDVLKSLLASKSPFKVEDTIKALEMSRRSANRLLEKAVKQGLIIRHGKGISTYYEWLITTNVIL